MITDPLAKKKNNSGSKQRKKYEINRRLHKKRNFNTQNRGWQFVQLEFSVQWTFI